MTDFQPDNSKARDPAASFGFSYSIAVIAVAIVNALSGLFPSFEEWAEATFSHAWLHVGILGITIFLVLGFVGIGRGQEPRRIAFLIAASTVIAGVVTVAAAALAGSRGSM